MVKIGKRAILVSTLIGLILGVAIGDNTKFNHTRYLLQEKASSCEGIDNFYTGNGFEFDVEILQNRIARCRFKTDDVINDTFKSEWLIL